MLEVVKASLLASTNGGGAINARGIHCRKWNEDERLAQAVNAVLGKTHVIPTIGRTAADFNVSVPKLRAKLKAHARAQARAARAATKMPAAEVVPEPTAEVAAEIMPETAVETAAETTAETAFIPLYDTDDTPEVRISLRRLAAALGCEITQLAEADVDPRLDCGPYVLMDTFTGMRVWESGLPIAGISDALKCLAHERQLPRDRAKEAWVDFGATWL
jgi:hypothetical protein